MTVTFDKTNCTCKTEDICDPCWEQVITMFNDFSYPKRKAIEQVQITYWPCSFWCRTEELEQYNYMGNDHTTILIPETLNEEEVDTIVEDLNK